MALFELETFIEACRRAIAGTDPERAIRELVVEAIADPRIATILGEPQHAGFRPLYRAPELTIMDFAWAPLQCFKPHDHQMWSVVGLIDGREDNVMWRRRGSMIEASGACSLGAGDATILAADTIHSVTNPIGKRTRAIHVYGGDFFAPPVPRSEWDHETLVERPWDLEDTRRRFADAEARFASGENRVDEKR